MATKTMRGKCPKCCPDGGAIFSREYEPVGDTDKWHWVKKCRNCGFEKPIRKTNYKPDGPNAKQQRIITRIVEAFGGTHEVKMMGRRVWITAKNYEGRKFFEGQSFFGTIGPKGALNITLQRPFGDAQIKDLYWDVRTYLTTKQAT